MPNNPPADPQRRRTSARQEGSRLRSPFSWVVEQSQGKLLAFLTLLVVALTAELSATGSVLVTAAAPYGLVSFELAGQYNQAAAILESWTPGAREWAMWIQGLDSLYLIVYPAWFSLAAAQLGTGLGGRWQVTGLALSWLVLTCAPFDALENYALVQQLIEGPTAGYAALARWCAIPKFGLVVVAALFVALAALARLGRRLREA